MNFWSMSRVWPYRFKAIKPLWHKTTIGYLRKAPWGPSTEGLAEAMYQTNDSLQWALQTKMCGLACSVTHCVTLQPPCQESFSVFFVCFVFLSNVVIFYFGRRLQGQRIDTNRWGDEWDWDASFKIHKEAIKCLRKKKMKMVQFKFYKKMFL